MLDLLRDNEANNHATKLEWIVIVLICVETLVGIFELLGLFGLAGLGEGGSSSGGGGHGR
jgi:hypothetical protein